MIEHPYAFFLAFFALTLALGIWIGQHTNRRRIARLKTQLEIERTLNSGRVPINWEAMQARQTITTTTTDGHDTAGTAPFWIYRERGTR